MYSLLQPQSEGRFRFLKMFTKAPHGLSAFPSTCEAKKEKDGREEARRLQERSLRLSRLPGLCSQLLVKQPGQPQVETGQAGSRCLWSVRAQS